MKNIPLKPSSDEKNLQQGDKTVLDLTVFAESLLKWDRALIEQAKVESRKTDSEQRLKQQAEIYGFSCKNVPGDGRCFYYAVIDQLQQNLNENYSVEQLINIASQHILLNFESCYRSVMPENQTKESFLRNLSNEWADNIMILAISRALRVNIVIIRNDGAKPTIFRRADARTTLFLGYELMEGEDGRKIGWHYQSLYHNPGTRPIEDIASYLEKEKSDTEPFSHLPIQQRTFSERAPAILSPAAFSQSASFVTGSITNDRLLKQENDRLTNNIVSDEHSKVKTPDTERRSPRTYYQCAIASGANSVALVVPALRQPEKTLPELWNVPTRNKNFVGRIKLLQDIESYFREENVKSNPLVLTACHGLGGVGKTLLALEYVWRHYKDYKGVCWLKIDDNDKPIVDCRARFINHLVNLGQELHLYTELDKDMLLEDKARTVKTWLENKAPTGWLIVIDGADKSDDISDLLPVKGGNILITSRHTEQLGQLFPVDIFTLEESLEYAKQIIGTEKINLEKIDLDELIKDLGRLPLALAQAFAYIHKHKINIAEYRDLYKKIYSKLLATNLLPTGDKHEAVAVTWIITLNKMQGELPESVDLMYFCAHIYNGAIPYLLIENYFSDKKETLPEVVKDKTLSAKRIAREYSMINDDENRKIISLHNLVQVAIVINLGEKSIDYLLSSVNILLQNCPYKKDKLEDIKMKRMLLPHFESVLFNLNRWLQHLSPQELETQKSRDICKEYLLTILIYLADIYYDLGNRKMRKEMLEQARVVCKKHFGKRHPKMALILNDLARAWRDLRDLEKSKNLLLKALSINEEHYNADHIEVAITLNYLANAYGELGDAKRKKELLDRALPIKKKHYGEKDIEVALILHDLANAIGDLGDVEQEKTLLDQVLAIEEQSYDKEHINIAFTLNDLAIAVGKLGNAKREMELLERILLIKVKHYGHNDPQVAITSHNLAVAIAGFEGILRMERVLEHVVACQENHLVNRSAPKMVFLAREQQVARNIHQMLENNLKIFEEHYGSNDIYIANALSDLGFVYAYLGDINMMKMKLEKALEIFKAKKDYGEAHEYYAICLSNLAVAEGALGNALKMKEMLERALFIQEAYYNNNTHQNIATVHYLLAYACLSLKLYTEAHEHANHASAIRENKFGLNHVYTVEAAVLLTKCKDRLSGSKEAFDQECIDPPSIRTGEHFRRTRNYDPTLLSAPLSRLSTIEDADQKIFTETQLKEIGEQAVRHAAKK